MTFPGTGPSNTPDYGFAPHAAVSYTARQIATAYGMPISQYDGTGTTVGIIELGGGYNASDMTGAGLPTSRVTLVSVDGTTSNYGSNSAADGEVMLDVEVVVAVAPGANVRVYFAPNSDQGFVDAVQLAINQCDVVTISWGGPEFSGWSEAGQNAMSSVLTTAYNNKIPVFVASGDLGSSDGTGSNQVDYPASDPHAIACGGTELRLNASNARVSEVAWGDSTGNSGSGGGVSTVFPGRHVPDIAGNASDQTAYKIRLDGQNQNFYGTSAVAPLFAAGYALLKQACGHSFDFLALCVAHPPAMFDVVSGTNGSYSAGTGRDDVTGLGVPNFGVLAAALPGKVTGLTVGTVTSSSVALSWTTTTGATSYQPEYRAGVSGAWTTVPSVTATNTTFTGLTASTGYQFRVTASSSDGLSTPSDPVSTTTAAADSTPSGPLIWSADFSAANDSYAAGFANVQYQLNGGTIQNNAAAIPSNVGTALKNALRITLAPNDLRREATPPDSWNAFNEGDVRFFRFDFLLGDSFQLNTSNWFNCINQIHHGGASGSPPIEFDVESGQLSVRGASATTFNTYHVGLKSVQLGVKYSVIYRVKFSATAANCQLDVWVDGTQVLTSYVPPSPNLNGGPSYWKGATLYRDAAIGAEEVFQSNHAVGTTYNAVALLNNGNGASYDTATGTPPGTNTVTTGTATDPFIATVPTTKANATVTWLGADWIPVTTGTPAYRSGALPNVERRSTKINYWSARQAAPTPGNQTIGMTAPTGQKWSLLGVELAAKTISSGGGDTPASVVPAKFVAGYLPNWITTLPRDVPATYNLLFLAFATINANGSVVFTPSQSPTALAADIATRTAQNKPTILSVGGGGGSQSGLGTTAQQDAFFNSVTAVIDQYGFQGVDWDLETGISGGISTTGLASLSRRLVARYGGSFAITMAPYGSTASVYKTLASSIADILTFVGYQFYNDNQIPTASFVQSVMEDWMTTCGLREDQFALGFMHVDTFLGLTTPYTTMASIYNAVNAAHPGVRGVYEWSIQLDQAEGYPFAPALGPAVLGTGPAPVPTVRPISEDITTPAVTRVAQSTGTSASSPSFNPPVGSLVVVLVSVGWKAIPAGTPTLTCTDTLGGVWTAGPSAFGNASQSAIFYRRITALGGMSVKVTSSSAELKAFLLSPRVLLNAAESQAGAGRASVVNSMTTTLGTTTEGSWAYVASSSGNNVALTPTAATTNIDAWVDPVSGDDMALGRMTTATATPGPVALGWAGAGRSVSLEILPGIAIPARSFTLGSVYEVDSVSRIYRGVLGSVTETDTVSPITRVRSRTLGSVTEFDAVSPMFDKQYVTDDAWADAIESDDRQPVIGLWADWSGDGQYAHPLSDLTPLVESVTVERTIDGTLPAEVGLVEGSASASLRAELVGRWNDDESDISTGAPEGSKGAGFGTIPFGTGPFGGGTPSTTAEVAETPTWEGGLSPVEAFAPYRPDAPFYGHPMVGTGLKFDTGFVTDDGPRLERRFTGSVRRVNPSSSKQVVSLTGLDPANMLRKPVSQPSVGIDKYLLDIYGPDRYIHRYNSQWLIDRALRENGIYASPPPHPKAVISVSGHGAYIPEIGHCSQPFEVSPGSPTVDSTWTNEGHPFGMLYNHPDGPNIVQYLRPYGQSPVNMNPGSVIGMSAWMRLPNYAQAFGLVMWYEQSFGSSYTMQFAVRNGQPGCSLNLGGNIYRIYAPDWVIPAEPVWMFVAVEVEFSATTAIMTLRADGKTYRTTYSIVARPPARAETRVLAYGQVPATNLSVWPGTYGTTDPTVLGQGGEETWASQADLDPGLNNFTYIPELAGEDSWKLIQEVVGAEFGSCGFNESGRFWFRSRAIARDRGNVEQITANRNLTDLVTTLDESAVRNSISVTSSPKYVSEDWEWVYELKDPQGLDIGPGWSVYDLPLKEDTVELAGRLTTTEGVGFAYFIPENWEQHEQKRWARNVVMCPINSGATTIPVDINTYGTMVIYLDLIAPRVCRMAIYNPTTITLRFAKSSASTVTGIVGTANEEPAFKIPGRVLKEYPKTTQTIRDEGSINDFGERTYDLGGQNRWRHDLKSSAGIGESVLASTGRPVPVLEGVVVPHDPRRRLYDAVNVADPDGQGSVLGLIAGIQEQHSSSGATDTLTVRPIGPPGLGILDDPVLGVLDQTLILGT